MDKSREKTIEIFARDDAKWDKCFVDLNTLGYVTNAKFGVYNPPDDPEAKAVYDHAWNKEKNKQ
jgi:hypothetical protein